MPKPFEQSSPSPDALELKALLDGYAASIGSRMDTAIAQKDASLAEARAVASEKTGPIPEIVPAQEESYTVPTAMTGGDVHQGRTERVSEPAFDASVAPVVPDGASDSTVPTSTQAVGGGDQAAQLNGRRRGTKKPLNPEKIAQNAAAKAAKDAAKAAKKAARRQGVTASSEAVPLKEKEPIAEGKYRGTQGELLQVFRQGEDYWYKFLEGENEGQLLQVSGNESDAWQKVDDATEPKSAQPTSDTSTAEQNTEDVAEAARKDAVIVGSQSRSTTEGEDSTQSNTTPMEAPLETGTDPLEDWDARRLQSELGDKEFVITRGNGTYSKKFRGTKTGFVNSVSGEVVSLDEILNLLNKHHWVIESSTTDPDTGFADTLPNNFQDTVPFDRGETQAEQYDELFQGDIWVLRDAEGKVVKGLAINMFIPSLRGRIIVNATELDENLADESIDDSKGGRAAKSLEWSLEDLRAELRILGYVREKQGDQSEKQFGVEKKEAAKNPASEKNSGSEKSQEAGKEKKENPKPEAPEMSEIEKLRILVDEDRLAYVSTDYHQNSAWMKVKRFFGKSIGEKPGDADTDSALGRYKLALANLQEAQLGLLKKENLSGPELRKRMGEMLNYYKIEERIALAKTRDQVKMEAMNGGQTLVTVLEAIGREYNKLPRGAKYTLGAICLATGLLTGGGVIGGGAAAAASTLILVKRLVATTGTAVMADTGIEQWMDKRTAKSESKEKEEELKEIGDIEGVRGQEASFERLQVLIEKDIDQLDTKFKKQKRETLIRRSAVWGVAVAGMVGIGTSWASHLGGGSGASAIQERQEQYLRDHGLKPASAASAAEAGASRPAAAALPGQAVSAPTGAASVEGASLRSGVPGAGGAAEALSSREGLLLQKYDVVAADGKRGLWGILDRRLPGDIAPSDKHRVIASLENTLREKLEGKSPAELKVLGFGPKGIDDIHPGSTISFDKLLTKEEIQSALEGKTVVSGVASGVLEESKSGAARVVEAVAPTTAPVAEATVAPRVPITPIDEAANEQVFAKLDSKPMVPLDQVPDQTAAVRQAVFEDQANFAKLSNPRELRSFLAQNPDRVPLPEFTRTLGVMRRDIFLTPELVDYNPFTAQFDYTTHPNMGQVNMARVLEGAQNLRTGQWQEYALNRSGYPLHSTQIRSLEHLVAVAQNPQVFGPLGLPQAHETIDQYTRRIAAMAVALHKERPLALLMRKGNSLV